MKIWNFEKINLGQGVANFIARPRAQSCLATPLVGCPLLSNICLAYAAVPLSNTVKTLCRPNRGVEGSHSDPHTNLCKSCFHHMTISRIGSALTKNMSQTIT